ncbi:transposase [Bradyrhizobium sp. SZCCHNS3002]|uniref:transposase n=1 Tax=Bradyrhizobium sp. SZCCHNS3002 TaxID=3057310 RepID=UPI0028E3C00D|nr:transposase [Bradyrhizobium sp. SZCCHNS3002]
MQLDIANLPSVTDLLQRLVRDIAAAVDHRDTEIERLKSIIKQLQRMQFGRSSEPIDPDQLALGLEDLDSDIGRVEEAQPKLAPETKAPSSPFRHRRTRQNNFCVY